MGMRKLTLSFLVLALLLTGCSRSTTPPFMRVEEGMLNLTASSLSSVGTVRLDGNWEFYWNRLLQHGQLREEEPDILAAVPSTWDRYLIAGDRLPGQGHATYRLHVQTDLPPGSMLGLRIYPMSSAYQLYVNEQLIAANGQVSTLAAGEVGEYRPQVVFFHTPAAEFDLILQVSNYHYDRGGFWYGMSLGEPAAVLRLHDSVMGKEIFLLGALAIIMALFLAVYLLQRELKYALYFSLLCGTLLVASDMVGQFILLRPFPGISLNAVIALWYSSTGWAAYLFVRLMHELFPSRFSGAVSRIGLIIAALAQGICLLTAPSFYTRFAQFANLLDTLAIALAVVIVAIGIRQGQEDGWLHILSMAIALAAYLHDILYWTNRLSGGWGELIYVGLFLMLLLQMTILARRVKSFTERERAAELAALQAQIKPHFLFNTLNSFVSISRYDMDKARTLIYDFSNYLRRSFDFRGFSQFVPLRHEVELAQAYLQIEQARFEERILVEFEVSADLDLQVPILILQPLIENAVIHGILPKPEGGCVSVFVARQGQDLYLRVKDDGIGMAEGLPAAVAIGDRQGVGLANIDQRLRRLFGRGLQVQSEPGQGTEISWSIPLHRRGARA